jgi:hypothetical protein
MDNELKKILSQYDAEFSTDRPEGAGTNIRPGAEVLADGDHTVTVLEATATFTEKTSQPLVRWTLRTADGLVFEYAQFLTSQVGVNIVGSTLVTLGIDADTWTARGIKFSEALAEALAKVAGAVVQVKKKTEVGRQDGKSRPRLYFNQRVGRGQSQAAPVYSAPPGDDNDIPF